MDNGVEVKSVLGDRAYSEKENIKYSEENEIALYSKLLPTISNGKTRKNWDFNKDAGMFICPAGHLTTRKTRTDKKRQNKNQNNKYYFDIEKCKICPISDAVINLVLKAKPIVSLSHQIHILLTKSFKKRSTSEKKLKIGI